MSLHDSRAQLIAAQELISRALADLDAVDRRLAQWAGPAKVIHNGPSGKGGHGDPTASAALGIDSGSRERRKFHILIGRLADIARDVDHVRATTMAPPLPKDPAERGHADCANQYGCPDEAKAAKAGRCLPCYNYRYHHGTDKKASPASP